MVEHCFLKKRLLLFYQCFTSVYVCFSITKKVANYLGEVLDDQRDKLQENLLANGGTLYSCARYLKSERQNCNQSSLNNLLFQFNFTKCQAINIRSSLSKNIKAVYIFSFLPFQFNFNMLQKWYQETTNFGMLRFNSNSLCSTLNLSYKKLMKLCYGLYFVFTVDLNTYLTRFQWDLAKYPIKQSLRNITEIISKVGFLSNVCTKVFVENNVLLIIEIMFW